MQTRHPRLTSPSTLSSSSEGTQGGNGRLRRDIEVVCLFLPLTPLGKTGGPRLGRSCPSGSAGHYDVQVAGPDVRDQTLEKAAIDLGPKEACPGLTFVCFSRAKRLVDLMTSLSP